MVVLVPIIKWREKEVVLPLVFSEGKRFGSDGNGNTKLFLNYGYAKNLMVLMVGHRRTKQVGESCASFGIRSII